MTITHKRHLLLIASLFVLIVLWATALGIYGDAYNLVCVLVVGAAICATLLAWSFPTNKSGPIVLAIGILILAASIIYFLAHLLLPIDMLADSIPNNNARVEAVSDAACRTPYNDNVTDSTAQNHSTRHRFRLATSGLSQCMTRLTFPQH